jgi:hypothetical protein
MAGITSLLRAIYNGGGNESERSLVTDKPGNLLMAHGMPEYAELVRKGVVWSAMNTAALAALVVRPSTVANFTLFNNEPEGGLTYLVLRAFAFNLVTTAAEGRSGLWLCSHSKGLVSPTNDITARGSHSGKANYGGRAVCDTAMTVVDGGFFPWGQTTDVEPTGVLPGSVLTVEVRGMIQVPPQCGVSTQVVSSVVGNTFVSGFTWAEVQLDMM